MLKSRIAGWSEKPRLAMQWIFFAGMILAVVSIGLMPARIAAAPVPQAQGAGLGPGCATNRPAVAHHAGGAAAQAPRGNEAPIPCVTKTGLRVGEESIIVTNAGTVLLRPIREADAIPVPKLGIARSIDEGATWDSPSSPSNDSNMWYDRTTGRAFWVARMRTDISDDDGKSWYSGGRTLNFDHIQIFGGPPVASMKHLMKDYPNVVYVCVGHSPLKCQRSLDGGMTFGPELDIPYPRTPEVDAIQGPSHDCSSFGLQGVVDKEGTVYVPYGPCNRPFVAISHDEGENWKLVAVANTDEIGYGYPSLGMDDGENLYASWVGASDRLPYMSISTDHGMHWGTPIKINAPGVNEAAVPYLVAGAKGQVAITYYGSTNAPIPFPPSCFENPAGARPLPPVTPAPAPAAPAPPATCKGYENEKWNTYITETWNALDAQPLFWSATLNDPAQPTWYTCTPSETGVIRWDEYFRDGPGHFRGCNLAGSAFDYYGATMAPDGTMWVGFAQECVGDQSANNPNCPNTGTTPARGLFGLVGRLEPAGERAMH